MIPFQVGSSKELEDRATQHQREIMLLLAEVVLWHCVQVLFSTQHDPLSINISFSCFDRSIESQKLMRMTRGKTETPRQGRNQ